MTTEASRNNTLLVCRHELLLTVCVFVFGGCLFTDKKRSKPDSVDCTPPDFIMPNSKERPLLPLHPGLKDLKVGPQFSGKKWVLSYHRIKLVGLQFSRNVC